MQLEKEKKEKRERERCRALAQRIAEEANPASAALLGEQMPLLTEALHRAGVETEEWTEGSVAELLVVADPAWETLPEILPARVLLVSDESTVMAGWAEQLAQRGYFRDFGWRSKGRAQQSALFCTSQPTQLKMVRGYEMEMDILRDRMVRAERTSGEEAELIARLRSDLSLSRSHEQQLEKALGEVTGSKFWKMTWPMRYVVSKSRQLWHTLPFFVLLRELRSGGIEGVRELARPPRGDARPAASTPPSSRAKSCAPTGSHRWNCWCGRQAISLQAPRSASWCRSTTPRWTSSKSCWIPS